MYPVCVCVCVCVCGTDRRADGVIRLLIHTHTIPSSPSPFLPFRAAKLVLETFMQRNFAGTLGRTETQRMRLMCTAVQRFTREETITDNGDFIEYEFRNRYQAKQWRSLMEVVETVFDELAAAGALTEAEITCVAALAELM